MGAPEIEDLIPTGTDEFGNTTFSTIDFVADSDGQMVETLVPFKATLEGSPEEFISFDNSILLKEGGVSEYADDSFLRPEFNVSETGVSEYIDDSFLGGGENILQEGFSEESKRKQVTDFLPGINQDAINDIPQLGQLDEFVRKKFGKGLTDSKMLNNPMVLSLIRGLGPQFAQSLLTPEMRTYSADMPQFRNPYGGY